jgi:hypothetical protein
MLACPVHPHNGKMLPLDQDNNGPKLTYQGNPVTKDFHGRTFARVSGFDKYLFVYGGRLETNATYRGFDCITYAGTTCGASRNHQSEQNDLAESLGAETVSFTRRSRDQKTGKDTVSVSDLERADPADVKEFFSSKPGGISSCGR